MSILASHTGEMDYVWKIQTLSSAIMAAEQNSELIPAYQ